MEKRKNELLSTDGWNLTHLSTEIRNGLIGVGLINVEDRSGVLSLDKGKFIVFICFLFCLPFFFNPTLYSL